MGPTYARLGLESGEALGLAMATVGLLASTLVGGLVVVLARRRRWLLSDGLAGFAAGAASAGGLPATPAQAAPTLDLDSAAAALSSPAVAATEPVELLNRSTPLSAGPPPAQPLAVQAQAGQTLPEQARPARPVITPAGPPAPLALGAVNLALNGVAVAIGWGMLEGLRLLAERLGGGFAMVIEALPVFPLALVGSLLVRLVLERNGQAHWASAPIQNRIGTLSADLLITAATACLDLSLLAKDWLPLTVLAVVGLLWNLAVFLLLAPRILPSNWFERGLIEFGQATGVAASGLLLLNMVDPEDRNGTLTPFSIKQLLLQPLLAGGVITVVAPLAVDSWGLPTWTAFCLALVVLWIGLGLWLAGPRAGT